MINGYIIDTLTPVDVRENIKVIGKVTEIYEGVVHRENFKISFFYRSYR